MAEMIFENMKQVSFEGVKSPIVFDSNLDPIITVKIERVQSKPDFSVWDLLKLRSDIFL